MASTTKTTNLELSQFVGTDKPAWLTDYNGDMQKIDNGYKKLEDANTATQADLDATKQDLSGSQTDIDNVKANVQALEAQDITLGNRLTVVEGNYDTIHHEVAINTDKIDDITANYVDTRKSATMKKGLILGNQETLAIYSGSLRKGDTLTSDSDMQLRFQDVDSPSPNMNENSIGRIVAHIRTNGDSMMEMVAPKWEAGNKDNYAVLRVGMKADGTSFTEAPTPTNTNAKNNEIATTKWVYNKFNNFKVYKGTISAGATLTIGLQPYAGMYEFMSGHAGDTTLIGDYKVFGTNDSTASIVTNVKEASALTVTPTNNGLTVKNNSSSTCEYVFIRYYCGSDVDVTFA